MIQWLQLETTRAACGILERLQILHHRAGVIIQLPNQDLFVDETCSGIQSLFTLFGLALAVQAYAYPVAAFRVWRPPDGARLGQAMQR